MGIGLRIKNQFMAFNSKGCTIFYGANPCTKKTSPLAFLVAIFAATLLQKSKENYFDTVQKISIARL